MLSIRTLALSLMSLGLVVGQTTEPCPPVPTLDLGAGVPPNPAHIPEGCSDYEILVARGTGEPNAPGGKFGVIVGDPVVTNTTLQLPGARGYPVQYPASIDTTGVSQGSADVVSRIRRQALRCPRQTFSLVGYSQGAAVMHAAAGDIPRYLYPRIKSLVMFGDGYNRLGFLGRFPTGLNDKARQVCAPGDPICDPDAGNCTYWHLVYVRPDYINPVVDFIVEGFTGN
ncbi:carbohydrate esterase family 5 protein [Parathielavia hyrcaniae]|uniref:Carbohydrate esterase family 5 protein n=1 Tax=Parathielavia hyrcaniae TaxID=113614 RepID=A0AAN6PSR4_9PEZI|nr:carbohydrate esterase family 5 protein [Parathielavia hyrcaniae]